MSRSVTILGTMFVNDHENIGSDKHVTKQYTFPPRIIMSPQTPIETRSWEVRMGGEIRIELDVVMILSPVSGRVTVHYNVRLYEGESETTNDLDGWGSGSTTVARDGFETLNFTVKNLEEGGRDRADVKLIVANARV